MEYKGLEEAIDGDELESLSEEQNALKETSDSESDKAFGSNSESDD